MEGNGKDFCGKITPSRYALNILLLSPTPCGRSAVLKFICIHCDLPEFIIAKYIGEWNTLHGMIFSRPTGVA